MNTAIIYTDGGCIGNPGPGGWAFVLVRDGLSTTRNGAERQTTNNRMELTAVIMALRYLDEVGLPSDGEAVRVITDSEYVRRGVSEWIHTWLKNGWKTSNRKPVKNQDLWVVLHELQSERRISWEWVKGHSGNEFNELCDNLVHEAIDTLTV
jgi:ribonuclease HI